MYSLLLSTVIDVESLRCKGLFSCVPVWSWNILCEVKMLVSHVALVNVPKDLRYESAGVIHNLLSVEKESRTRKYSSRNRKVRVAKGN